MEKILGILFWVFFIYYMWFLKGEVKAKINFAFQAIGAVSIILGILVFLYGMFFNDISSGKGNHTTLTAILFGGGLGVFLFFSFMNIFSNQAWADRDDSKDTSKFRVFYGICIHCKKKVNRFATKCPYCHSDLNS